MTGFMFHLRLAWDSEMLEIHFLLLGNNVDMHRSVIPTSVVYGTRCPFTDMITDHNMF